MAILKMNKVNIYALKKLRKPLLESLQKRGVIEIADFNMDEKVEKIDTLKTRLLFEKNISNAQNALSTILSYSNLKASSFSFAGKENMDADIYNNCLEQISETNKKCSLINDLQSETLKSKSEVLKLENELESLKPWENLDVSMQAQETKHTVSFIGVLEGQWNVEIILNSLVSSLDEDQIKKIHVEIISERFNQTCIFLICLNKYKEKVEKALSELGFSRPSLRSYFHPQEEKQMILQKIDELSINIENNINRIKEYIVDLNAIKLLIDYYTVRVDKYKAINRLAHTNKTFIVSGFIPERDLEKLSADLEKEFNAFVEVLEEDVNENAPVFLKNNAFVSPVESILESYSLPSKGEVDPTSIMAIFHYLFFGLMVSDAAYGLIIVSVCSFILLKFKNIEFGMKRSIKLFWFCGISTFFWGVMFGSYFGDAIEVVARTFFGVEVTIAPIWFFPVKEPMRMLAFAFVLGIMHLFTGLAIKFYQLVKEKKYKDAIFDVVFWYMLVGGGIVYLLSMKTFKDVLSLNISIPKGIIQISIILVLIGSIGIVLTAGRGSKSFFKKILKGLYSLYNVTGYLSDILSYSRLLALGMATGVIATVFNKMGSMAGGSVIGFLIFTIVFIIGHGLNIGINLLGAYVHTNRLQFVEFFGKFYEGGGRKFSPFSIKTKYYKFREDISNG